jgi:hypothetical protein
LLSDPSAIEAIDVLKRDFQDHEGIGPRRVADFILGVGDNVIQADVVGFIRQLLKSI